MSKVCAGTGVRARCTCGCFEICARMPCGTGGRWLDDGRIDIREPVGRTPGEVLGAVHTPVTGGGGIIELMKPDTSLADAFARLMSAHRSIRSYKPDAVADDLVNGVLEAALQGTSSSGNLNLVSVVKSRDAECRSRLHELHGQQAMVQQAPLVLTFCADSFRTRQWLALRGARLGFADVVSWHTAAFDALLLAQTAALAFESRGLGICYMGTTLFSMRGIADLLELPDNVLPVTSLVVGWPDEQPAQRDRLPGAAWIHDERYQQPNQAELELRYAERERRGRARYLESSPAMAQLWAQHGISSLAQYYTSPIKYDPDRFAGFSVDIEALLAERGWRRKPGQ